MPSPKPSTQHFEYYVMDIPDVRHQSLTKVNEVCTQFSQKSKTLELIDI